jgi:small subunit ribosomal protein S3
MTDSEVHLNIVEVRKPDIDARWLPQSIASAAGAPCCLPPRHEAGRSERHAAGAQGIRINCGGRLGGAENRASNGTAKARCRCTRCAPTSITAPLKRKTAYGIIGVKVWIFKGEIMEHDPMASERRAKPPVGWRSSPD